MPPPGKISETDEADMEKHESDGIIRFEVGNISELMEKKQYSPEIDVHGVPWRMLVDCDNQFLYADLLPTNNQLTPWSVDVEAECTVVNVDGSIILSKTESSACGLSPSFAQKVMFEIEVAGLEIKIRFWLSNMKGIRIFPRIDFMDSNDPRHDVALVIEGVKIYASKQILAIHSDFFNSLFYGDFAEKNKKEIELNDVNLEEFLEMLHVVYPSKRKIIDECAEFLIKLGDRFQIMSLLERAELCLTSDSCSIPMKERLRIADKFEVFGLMKHAMFFLIMTSQCLKDIKNSSIYSNLSHATKYTLIERHVEVIDQRPNCYFLTHSSPPSLSHIPTLIRTFPRFDFADPNDPRHDFALVIEGVKVYTSKQLLACHSPVFNAMFFGDISADNKSEIELKDVNREEFLELLRVIYPSNRNITDQSADYLLKLGNRFQIQCVIDQAEKHIADSLATSLTETGESDSEDVEFIEMF